MRIVLDSNIIIASFVSRGLCKDVFEICLSDHKVVISKLILEEITHWLKKKLNLPCLIADEISSLLSLEVEIITASKVPHNSCRDPQDNEILGVALVGKADVIITGDKDLLVLEKFHSIPILSPRAFWHFIQKKSKKK